MQTGYDRAEDVIFACESEDIEYGDTDLLSAKSDRISDLLAIYEYRCESA